MLLNIQKAVLKEEEFPKRRISNKNVEYFLVKLFFWTVRVDKARYAIFICFFLNCNHISVPIEDKIKYLNDIENCYLVLNTSIQLYTMRRDMYSPYFRYESLFFTDQEKFIFGCL